MIKTPIEMLKFVQFIVNDGKEWFLLPEVIEQMKNYAAQFNQVEGLREDAESYFERSKQTFTGVFAGDYLDREDFINYIISSSSGQEKDAVDYKAKYEKCINVIKRFDAGIIGLYDL